MTGRVLPLPSVWSPEWRIVPIANPYGTFYQQTHRVKSNSRESNYIRGGPVTSAHGKSTISVRPPPGRPFDMGDNPCCDNAFWNNVAGVSRARSQAVRRRLISKYRRAKMGGTDTTCRQLWHPYWAAHCSGCRSAIHLPASHTDAGPSGADALKTSCKARAIPEAFQSPVPSGASPLTNQPETASDGLTSDTACRARADPQKLTLGGRLLFKYRSSRISCRYWMWC